MPHLQYRSECANLTIYFTQFSDVALLLRTYQLWLDELYPRAKFADGLAIIEKLGHTKRLQIMRKAWIDEGKPKASFEVDDDAFEEPLPLTVNPGSETEQIKNGSSFDRGIPEIDVPRTGGLRPSAGSPLDEIHGAPDEDELDALLAEDLFQNESEKRNSFEVLPESRLSRAGRPPEPVVDDDDEDMMREMGMW
jgi:replication fork protection complex subunit Csm3/Swi3